MFFTRPSPFNYIARRFREKTKLKKPFFQKLIKWIPLFNLGWHFLFIPPNYVPYSFNTPFCYSVTEWKYERLLIYKNKYYSFENFGIYYKKQYWFLYLNIGADPVPGNRFGLLTLFKSHFRILISIYYHLKKLWVKYRPTWDLQIH